MYHHIERCRGLRRNHQDLPRTVNGLIVLNGLQPALRQIPAVCLSSDFHSGASPLAIMIIEGTGLEREREPPAEFLRPILSNENDARRRFQIFARSRPARVAIQLPCAAEPLGSRLSGDHVVNRCEPGVSRERLPQARAA